MNDVVVKKSGLPSTKQNWREVARGPAAAARHPKFGKISIPEDFFHYRVFFGDPRHVFGLVYRSLLCPF